MNDDIKEVRLDLRKEPGPREVGGMKETGPGWFGEFMIQVEPWDDIRLDSFGINMIKPPDFAGDNAHSVIAAFAWRFSQAIKTHPNTVWDSGPLIRFHVVQNHQQ